MFRFGWLAIPAAIIVAAATWLGVAWVVQPTVPDLGRPVVVDPAGVPSGPRRPSAAPPTTSSASSSPAPKPEGTGGASVISPLPPQVADVDDADVDDLDNDDDTGDD